MGRRYQPKGKFLRQVRIKQDTFSKLPEVSDREGALKRQAATTEAIQQGQVQVTRCPYVPPKKRKSRT